MTGTRFSQEYVKPLAISTFDITKNAVSGNEEMLLQNYLLRKQHLQMVFEL